MKNLKSAQGNGLVISKWNSCTELLSVILGLRKDQHRKEREIQSMSITGATDENKLGPEKQKLFDEMLVGSGKWEMFTKTK